MSKKELLIVADYSNENFITLEELCQIVGIHDQLVRDFMLHDIIKPAREGQPMYFDLAQLQRVQMALRLQRDLEVNLAGAALVLDLLEEMHRLEEKAALLERYFKNS